MGIKNTQLEKKLKKFKIAIQKKYEIKQMILFGSQARGDTRTDSDVDLILVSPIFSNKNNQDESRLYQEWHIRHKLRIPVDFLCYSQKEFDKLKNRISIVSQAIKEGIEI
ncbi:MAG: nucleotidyltransferase domain-containing protein [Nanoarchaeota archaeon]|mgnify:CR=1 FL=1